MKEQIYESPYLKIFFDKENQMFEEIFTDKTSHWSAEGFKNEMLKLVELTKEYRPIKALVNLKNFLFPIEPDLQEWQNREVFEKGVELGLKQTAMLVSSNIFAQVSVEQTMDEESGKKIPNRYFENEDEARQWLLG